MSHVKRSLLTLTVLVMGCGVVEADHPPLELSKVQLPIVGGAPTTGDPNVFMLIAQDNKGQTSLCTATLIDRRTLLTAAHCVDPTISGATSANYRATNAATIDDIRSGVNLYDVVETRKHPNWNSATITNDIAMVLLATAPPVAPKPWNASSLNGYGGRTVRALGYGTTGANGGDGTKRVVELTIRQLTTTLMYIGNQVDKGICHGDSGGPTFLTFPDGVERIIGVHSFTRDLPGSPVCVDGADSRVDTFQAFVKQWLAEKEAPSCGEDGRCVTSCSTPDIDCLCVRDGVCSTACPNLSKDPDCPPDCGANGVCSTNGCPVPDPDCHLFGTDCTQPAQCQYRKCVVDPQHPAPYCSQPCSAAVGCPTGFECAPQGHCQRMQLPSKNLGEACTAGQTWCGAVGVCTGPTSSSTVCALPCNGAADCAAPRLCQPGFDGVKRCVDPPPVVLELAKTEGPVANGCATAPGVLLLLAALTLRRPRRAA